KVKGVEHTVYRTDPMKFITIEVHFLGGTVAFVRACFVGLFANLCPLFPGYFTDLQRHRVNNKIVFKLYKLIGQESPDLVDVGEQVFLSLVILSTLDNIGEITSVTTGNFLEKEILTVDRHIFTHYVQSYHILIREFMNGFGPFYINYVIENIQR